MFTNIAYSILVTVMSAFLLTGCSRVADLVPPDSEIPWEDIVEIRTGKGVGLRSVDGAKVSADRVLALPGKRSVRINVRRALRDVEGDRIEGYYQTGTCRAVFDAKNGHTYVISTRTFAEPREVLAHQDSGEKSEEMMMSLRVLLINDTTGSETLLPEDSCGLRIVCQRLDGRSTGSSRCR